MSDYPEAIPLFPLPNVVLFPGVPLPLHVFEPRYRKMVEEMRERGEDLLGMVLLRGSWRDDYFGNPEIFSVGCAGRVVETEKLANGRYNILLDGVCEFSIAEEVPCAPYRRARVQWRMSRDESLSPALREHLCNLLHELLERVPRKQGQQLLDERSLSDRQLVNFFSYALDFAPLEKQGLLEARGLSDRASRLCDALSFVLCSGGRFAENAEPERYH